VAALADQWHTAAALADQWHTVAALAKPVARLRRHSLPRLWIRACLLGRKPRDSVAVAPTGFFYFLGQQNVKKAESTGRSGTLRRLAVRQKAV